MQDGRTAEVGAVGSEGLIGLPALLGLTHLSYECIVQVDGAGRRISTGTLKAEMARNHELREMVLRYMEYRISQLTQTAA